MSQWSSVPSMAKPTRLSILPWVVHPRPGSPCGMMRGGGERRRDSDCHRGGEEYRCAQTQLLVRLCIILALDGDSIETMLVDQ